MIQDRHADLPPPAPASPEGEMAHGLTFFFTSRERCAVLAQLRRLAGSGIKKEVALIRALGVDAQIGSEAEREHKES